MEAKNNIFSSIRKKKSAKWLNIVTSVHLGEVLLIAVQNRVYTSFKQTNL